MDSRRAADLGRRRATARLEPMGGVARADRFVGRSAEIAELLGDLEEVLAGRRRVRLLVGEAGIGKTRTAEELARRAEAKGFRILWGRSHDDAGEPPFWPWAQAVRAFVTGLSEEELRELGVGAPMVAEIAPVLAERFPDLQRASSAASEQGRFALFASFAEFLAAATVRCPLLVMLDDAHWADDASLRLLRFVARDPTPARLFVIATLREADARRRPEIRESLADLDRIAPRVALSGLGADDVGRLADLALGRGVERGLGQSVQVLTGGNPFFVAEVLRAVVRAGEVSAATLEALDVPAGVRALVRRRLGLLTPEARRLLEAAAVIGETFDLEIARTAAKVGRARALELLDEARADALVVERGGPSQIAFVHALVREVVAADLTVLERGRLHLGVARAIETAHASDLDRHAAALVRHYEFAAGHGTAVAKAASRAVECAGRAAEQALAHCAFEDACAYLTRALSLLVDAEAGDSTRADLLVRLGEARACGGDKEGARAVFSAAADLARRSGLASQLGRAALGFAGTKARILLRAEAAVIDLLEEALASVSRRADPALHSRLQARLAMELVSPAAAERRLLLADESVAGARRARDDRALTFALTVRHLAVFGAPEDVDVRLAAAREVVEIARRNRSDELTADGLGFLVRSCLEAGRIGELDEALQEQLRLAEHLGQPEGLWHVTLRRVMRALLAGRLGEADALADESARLAARAPLTAPGFVLGLQRTMIQREQGRLAEIDPVLRAFVEAAMDVPQAPFLVAWLHASMGRRDEAAATFEIIARDRFAVPAVDRLAALTFAAETCCFLGDRAAAAVLRDLLRPHVHRNAIVGNALALLDCVARPLGLLAATLGEMEEAEQQFEVALTAYRRLGAVARRAHVAADLADVLLARGDDARRSRARDLLGDAARVARDVGLVDLERRASALAAAAESGRAALRPPAPTAATHAFRREGEYWSISYPGEHVLRFRDARGMRQIAFLLARPGEDVSVLDLVAAGEPEATDRTSGPRGDPFEGSLRSHLGDAGEVLDERSRRAYRDRIRGLREQVEEARACNDGARASAAEHEIEVLRSELNGAFDARGGARSVASHLERARVSTTRTLRDAIRRISEEHPQLGYHLERTIKTGRLCSYTPPPGTRIAWQVG